MATGFDAGTAGAPGLYVNGDTNTGLSSPASDKLQVSVGGQSNVVFQRGAARFYGGSGTSDKTLAIDMTNNVPYDEVEYGRLVLMRFYGKTDQNNTRAYGFIRGYADDYNDATLKGRVDIAVADGPTISDQITVFDAFADQVVAGVPYRYDSSIDTSDLTNSKDFASIEKVDEQIAAGVGAPFPVHVPLLGSVADATYPLISKVKKSFKINGITLKSSAGSAAVTVNKNGAAVSGLSSLSVGTSASDHTPTGNGTEDFALDTALSVTVVGSSNLSNLTIDIDAELIQ